MSTLIARDSSFTAFPSRVISSKDEPTDYKVTFINPDTAIMTHGTKGTDAHYSLHVWSRKSGTWQVVATSTTPVARGK
jgi:hypothetical protein